MKRNLRPELPSWKDKAALSPEDGRRHDIAALAKMVHEREAAMKTRDIASVMAQFSDDATFINAQGYYCANKAEVEAFHKQLMFREGVGYNYLAGKETVRLLDESNALVYYPWKMDFSTWQRQASSSTRRADS